MPEVFWEVALGDGRVADGEEAKPNTEARHRMNFVNGYCRASRARVSSRV